MSSLQQDSQVTCGGAELFDFKQDVPQDLLQTSGRLGCQRLSQRQQCFSSNSAHIITLVLQAMT